MIPIERFSEIVEEELKLLPDYVFEELNGGVIVDEKVNLHPDRLADDLYIMGTYSHSQIMGKQIAIFYGSFAATMGDADEETIRLKIRDTLRHEFRHHMETRAGFFGDGTLIDEDKREMDRYFLMHAKRKERAEAAASESEPVQVNAVPAGGEGDESEGIVTGGEYSAGAGVTEVKTEPETGAASGREPEVLPGGFRGVRWVSGATQKRE